MEQDLMIKKMMDDLRKQGSFSDYQCRIIEQHLAMAYGVGYDFAMEQVSARPKPVEQWYRPADSNSDILIRE